MKSEYDQQAIDFLEATNTKIHIERVGYDYHFVGDKERHNRYRVILTNEGARYSFMFGDSINNSNKNLTPTAYDVLSCLTKYDIGSFEDFCGDYGYENEEPEDRTASMKIYKAVLREWQGMNRLFDDEQLDQLREIQ